ncbi:MAG TPA: hypothetical protein VGC53_11275 [Vicinamibacteria bacterium]
MARHLELQPEAVQQLEHVVRGGPVLDSLKIEMVSAPGARPALMDLYRDAGTRQGDGRRESGRPGSGNTYRSVWRSEFVKACE